MYDLGMTSISLSQKNPAKKFKLVSSPVSFPK